MRKRTQLVGFEFGFWKHSQYIAEFLDNALDAVESFQWDEINKPDSNIKFTLDHELSLENLSILQTVKAEKKEINKPLNDEARYTLKQEFGIEPTDSDTQIKKGISAEDIKETTKIEIEVEVKNIIDDMEQIIQPVESIIDVEPIVIIRLTESEAASYLTAEINQKNVMSYSFEIFDNGTGMAKSDLRKFGKYLASSKSMRLKQTRGSQGFGAPSAFSDSQNTTGKPIIAVSKSPDNIYATVSEFFTTSKNEKKYVVHPTDVDCPFLHGTYIKLNYLNVKYVRGYVDVYIRETALMNPHITIIFIDPYNEEYIYPRKVSTFTIEPKYAKPHPSSTNIGDLQDLLSKTENLTIKSFLQESFVRVSSKIAKEIIVIAERDLQDKLNLLVLNDGYVEKLEKKTDPIHFLRFEKRVFGQSTNPRDKLIIYEVESEEFKNSYWELISNYNKLNKNKEKLRKQISKHYNQIEKAETQKIIKEIEKEIKNLSKNIDDINKDKENVKIQLNSLFKIAHTGLIEQKKIKNRSDFEDLVEDVQLSKVKPLDIKRDQFNSLFFAFKSTKFLAPPTDTAVPVGDNVLENTLIKELGLKISDNLDDFDIPVDSFEKLEEKILEEKKRELKKEDPSFNDDDLNAIVVDDYELVNTTSLILSSINITNESQENNRVMDFLLTLPEGESEAAYSELFEYFIENFTKDDDFVAAETRAPTSGKGLAYVVEAVMAHSKQIEVPKRSRDVLSRFVNRTPKLRDSADCAITKAVQSVNWKNYKLEVYDNNLPKGPIKVVVNVSGPYVHLMFKSQSKASLADDENLIKEIKYCLESIGRKIRVYLNRKANLYKNEKRASLIEKYIPKFVKSVYNIASQGESKYKGKISEKELIDLMRGAIGKKTEPSISQMLEPETSEPKSLELKKEEPKKEIVVKRVEPKKEVISIKNLNDWTVAKLRAYCQENNIRILSRETKNSIINKIQESLVKEPIKEKPEKEIIKKIEPKKEVVVKRVEPKKEVVKEKPKRQLKIEPLPPGTVKEVKARLDVSKGKRLQPQPVKKPISPKPRIAPPKPRQTQTQLPVITNEKILGALSNEWQTIKHLIFKLKIKDMMDARFLQIKLKELDRKGKVLVDIKMGKKQFKIK